jgi:hypothetical protein
LQAYSIISEAVSENDEVANSKLMMWGMFFCIMFAAY